MALSPASTQAAAEPGAPPQPRSDRCLDNIFIGRSLMKAVGSHGHPARGRLSPSLVKRPPPFLMERFLASPLGSDLPHSSGSGTGRDCSDISPLETVCPCPP